MLFSEFFTSTTALASWVLSAAAALCIYLILLNRYLLLLSDGRIRTVVLCGTLALIGIAAALFGWWASHAPWPTLVIPIAVLTAVGIGEMQRIVLRRRYRGAPPVNAENAGIALASPITTMDLAVYHYELRVPRWRGRRLRIVHVSDLHLNGDLPEAYYRTAMARIARAEPDLLLFTGDLVTKVEHAVELPSVLTLARGRLATLAVLGNHDYRVGPEQVAAQVEAAGVTRLQDRCIRVDVDGHEVVLCGYEAPWSRAEWRPPVLAAHELGLILTHTPDNIYRLTGLGYAAVFAGHYHAGQVRLPWLGPIVVPSRYGRRFDHGHFVVDGVHLFITAGVGSAVPPRRIYCQPDIFIVDIAAGGD